MNLLREIILVIIISGVTNGRNRQWKAPVIHEIRVRTRPPDSLKNDGNFTGQIGNRQGTNESKHNTPTKKTTPSTASSQVKNEISRLKGQTNNKFSSLRRKVKTLMKAIRKGDKIKNRPSGLYRNTKNKHTKSKTAPQKEKHRYFHRKNNQKNRNKQRHFHKIRHSTKKRKGIYRSGKESLSKGGRTRDKHRHRNAGGHRNSRRKNRNQPERERGNKKKSSSAKTKSKRKKKGKEDTDDFQLDILVEQLADALCSYCREKKIRRCILRHCLVD